MGGAGGGDDGLRPETFDGSKLAEIADTKLRAVEGFIGKNAVREEMRGDIVEGVVLEK